MGVRQGGGRPLSLALLAGLLPLLHTAAASAEAPFQTAGAGLFFGYEFGERGGFEWGIEGFATRYFEQDSCPKDGLYGVGPLLRLTAVKGNRLKLTLAAHGGGELPELEFLAALDAEVGASFHFETRQKPRLALHTGVTLESLIFHFYVQPEWVEQKGSLALATSLGGGLRFYPTFRNLGHNCVVYGRPCRSGNGQPQVARVRRQTAFDERSPEARLWAGRVAEESASVPAFLQLASELAQLGAPAALVQRAMQAAREELGHTVAAARLAALFGGAIVAPALPVFRVRPALPRPLALRRLVMESWQDGVLNEGVSAAIADAEAAETRVPEEAQISRLIAREEAGHARLALDVMGWALTRAPELRRVLRARRATAAPNIGMTLLGRARARDLGQQSAARAAWQLNEIVA
jgi:hypothetical protein